MNRADTTHYREIFSHNTPLLDVRAPIEYQKGAFPTATNVPLMDDSEREKVGMCYKQHGQHAAIALGKQLVSGQIKAARLAAWAAFARQHPDGYMYCFRGGLRSQIAQQWLLDEAGVAYPRVLGGYKALRNFLLTTLDTAAAECSLIVVGGLTGSGKTDVLLQLPNSLDLEHHAHHRGSSFGKHVHDQPEQIDFENRAAIDVLKKRAAGYEHFVLEDESRLIGRCTVPLALHQRMQTAPMVWLEDPLDSRVQRIHRDYIQSLALEFTQRYGAEEGFVRFAERLRFSLSRITKRLGGERYQRLTQMLNTALVAQQQGDASLHQLWIRALLVEYYDPMYAYQQRDKAQRVVFTGDQLSVITYLKKHGN